MQRIYSNILFPKISVLDKMKWDRGDQHSLKHFCDYWFKSCNKGSRRYVFPIFGFITCNVYILTYYFQKCRSWIKSNMWDRGDQHSLKHFCDYWFKSCNKGSRRYVFPIFGFITCKGYILTYYFQKCRSSIKSNMWDRGDQHSLKHFCDYWFKSCNKGSRSYLFPIFGFITCNAYILTYYFLKISVLAEIKRV